MLNAMEGEAKMSSLFAGNMVGYKCEVGDIGIAWSIVREFWETISPGKKLVDGNKCEVAGIFQERIDIIHLRTFAGYSS